MFLFFRSTLQRVVRPTRLRPLSTGTNSMPPKPLTLSRSPSKRKVGSDDDNEATSLEEVATTNQVLKKQKSESAAIITKRSNAESLQRSKTEMASGSGVGTGPSRGAGQQPTNTKLPDQIKFPPPTPGAVKIVAWNVAGFAACQKKGFKRYIEAENPDILILNETKVNNIPADPSLESRFPHRYWSISDTKGYAGTAILSKHKPISIAYTFPNISSSIVKGRFVLLEFETCWLVGTYVPNAGANLKSMDTKIQWQAAFESHLRTLNETKPIIWGGDINVAPTAKDLKNDKSNWNKTAGYTAIECTAFAKMLNPPLSSPSSQTQTQTQVDDTNDEGSGPGGGSTQTTLAADTQSSQQNSQKLIDVWRVMHPADEHYTYFSFRFGARGKGMGWRIDSFVVSERLYPRIKTCEIRSEIWGASDHCPLILEIDGDL